MAVPCGASVLNQLEAVLGQLFFVFGLAMKNPKGKVFFKWPPRKWPKGKKPPLDYPLMIAVALATFDLLVTIGKYRDGSLPEPVMTLVQTLLR